MATGCSDNIIGDVFDTIPFIRLLYQPHPAAQALSQLYGVKRIMAKNLPTIKSPKKAKEKRVKAKYIEMMNPYVAGIDIGSRSHFVAAPVISEDSHEIEIKEFSCFTPDLNALADWLKEHKVTSVAMESTGVYWIPLYELLESRGFDVNLVDARHVKNVTGRKTDVEDCQWLQQLHASGLLSAAFRPADTISTFTKLYASERDIDCSKRYLCATHAKSSFSNEPSLKQCAERHCWIDRNDDH